MIFKKKLYSKILLVLLCLSTSSCVGVAAVGVAATGYLVYREKTITSTKDDIVANTKITKTIRRQISLKHFEKVDIMVNEGRVLLTGYVDSPNYGDEVEEIAWKTKGVNEVINELKIKDTSQKISAAKTANDSLITSTVKSKLAMSKYVKSANYKVRTLEGTVYLFGIAQNETEMRKAADITSRVKGVSNVVSHVVIKDDYRRMN